MPTNSPYRQWDWPSRETRRNISDPWTTLNDIRLRYGLPHREPTPERSLIRRLFVLAQHYGLDGGLEGLHVTRRGSYWVLDNFVDRVFLPVRYGDEGFCSTQNIMTAVDMTEHVIKRGKL